MFTIRTLSLLLPLSLYLFLYLTLLDPSYSFCAPLATKFTYKMRSGGKGMWGRGPSLYKYNYNYLFSNVFILLTHFTYYPCLCIFALRLSFSLLCLSVSISLSFFILTAVAQNIFIIFFLYNITTIKNRHQHTTKQCQYNNCRLLEQLHFLIMKRENKKKIGTYGDHV